MAQTAVQEQEPNIVSAITVAPQHAVEPVRRVPDEQLAELHRRWLESMQQLKDLAHHTASQYPEDRSAKYFLAEVLQAAGHGDLALDEFEKLRLNAPSNELPRVEQAIDQCLADKRYFPPVYTKRLSTGEYAGGHNAQTWRNYARRDIQRGREIVRMLQQFKPLAGKRVLDVGCGYGGMMICLAEQGAEVVGVEIDGERAQMGKARLAELGIKAECYESDVCEPGKAESLGTFDLITCQDVIEHVMDPTLMIQTVSKMLRPGGVIYLQMPNKWGAQQLMADHHYSLTGITALSRKQAIEYWQLATGENEPEYSVGYPRAERYYASAFAKCGVTLKPVQTYPAPAYVEWFGRDVDALQKRLQKETYPGLRPELDQKIRRRINKAIQLYIHASRVIGQLQAQPEQMKEACDYLVRRLGLPLWKFVGIKEAK